MVDLGLETEPVTSYLLEFNEAVDRAVLQGFEVVRGDSCTLLLDLDTEADRDHFERMQGALSTFLKYEIKDRWRSKSGIGEHVVLALEEPMPVRERLLLQAALGSDRMHEMLSLVTGVWRDNEEPSVLFKPGRKLIESAKEAHSGN